MQKDGKIVVVATFSSASSRNIAVARYNSDGTLDPTFNGGGLASTPIGSNTYNMGTALTLQPNAKIVTVGTSQPAYFTGSTIFGLARFLTNGIIDPAFGSLGTVSTAIGTSCFAYCVSLQADGKIVVAGTSGSEFALARYEGDAQLGLRSDLNGDHQIDFSSGSADQTSSTTPFSFWLNDDHDIGGETDGDDLNDGVPDYSNPAINCIRDLEDFAMLNLQLPSAIVASLHQGAKIVFSVAGTGSLNLVPVPRAGFDYLYDPIYAQTLTPYPLPGITVPSPITKYPASASASPAIPLDQLFTNPQSGDRTLGFLFEGVSAGDLVLSGTIVDSNGVTIAQTENFYLHLGEITEFYNHFSVGESEDPTSPVASVATELNANAPDATNPNVSYILFVHGWRLHTWQRVKFAETAFKRLYWAGYRGGFGLFSWPTGWIDTSGFQNEASLLFGSLANRQNYDNSELQAWKAATGLRNLIDSQLESGSQPRVHLLAHSMGNVSASEALKLGEHNTSAKIVNDYVASQAATVGSAYNENYPLEFTNPFVEYPGADIYRVWPLNTNERYFLGINAMTLSGIVSFANPSDYALNGWVVNQTFKPDSGYGFSIALNVYTMYDTNNQPQPIPYGVTPNAYSAFAFAAPASSSALGVQTEIGGEINQVFRLDQSPLGYSTAGWQHSGEFNSSIQFQHAYWENLLGYMGLATLPSNPLTTTPSSFQNWGQMWFGFSGASTTPQASFTNDGVSNLTKYAFGLNPLQSNGGPQVSISNKNSSGTNGKYNRTNLSNGINEIAIDFWCAANLSDVSYGIEESDDLVNWSAVTTPLTVISTSGLQELVEADIPTTGDAQQFYRVTATLNQSSSSSAKSKALLHK